MKRFFCFVFVASFFSGFGQQTLSVENLKQRLLQENDRQKIETYLDISEQLKLQDSVRFYLNKALITSEKIYFDSIYPIQFAYSVSYYMEGDFELAKTEIKKSISNYKWTENPEGTWGHINMLLGIFSEALNRKDSAYYYYDKVIERLKDNTSKKAIEVVSITYTNYANLYLKEGNYEAAIKIYLAAEKMSATVGDKRNQSISLHNAASCFKDIKKYEKALFYYKKALQLSKENGDLKYEGSCNLGIAEVYYFKENYKEALKYGLIAKDILVATEFKLVLHQVYESLAKIYLKDNEINKARQYSEKSKQGILEVQDDFAKVEILLTYAAITIKTKEYNKALKAVNNALLIAEKNKYSNKKKECISKKITIYKLQHKNELLIPLYERLLQLKDSILNKENIHSINELETKYQSEKKEKENLQLKAEKVKSKLEIEKENRQKWFFAAVALVAIATIFFIVVYTKNRRQKLLYKSQLAIAKAKQQEHQRIATDLHDYKVKTLEEIASELQNEGKEKLAQKVDTIKESIRKLSKEMSQISFLESEFNEQIITLLASYSSEDIQIHQKGVDDIAWKTVDETIKQNLFLVIREGISNAYNHSEAKNVSLVFQQKGGQLEIIIKDDGKGFEDATPGIGFTNMKMRINEINGKIKIESEKNAGTQIGIYLALV